MITFQRDLFDVGQRIKRHTARPCTPAPVGSGPPGKHCRDCAFYRRTGKNPNRHYPKCGKMTHAWTHGPASDIRANWAACREFHAKNEEA